MYGASITPVTGIPFALISFNTHAAYGSKYILGPPRELLPQKKNSWI
jgi:hypothetical protein